MKADKIDSEEGFAVKIPILFPLITCDRKLLSVYRVFQADILNED